MGSCASKEASADADATIDATINSPNDGRCHDVNRPEATSQPACRPPVSQSSHIHQPAASDEMASSTSRRHHHALNPHLSLLSATPPTLSVEVIITDESDGGAETHLPCEVVEPEVADNRRGSSQHSWSVTTPTGRRNSTASHVSFVERVWIAPGDDNGFAAVSGNDWDVSDAALDHPFVSIASIAKSHTTAGSSQVGLSQKRSLIAPEVPHAQQVARHIRRASNSRQRVS